MIDKHDELYKDLEAVKKISIVPAMLDVVCGITGLGFAAVARVTGDRWLACTVRDDVNFGLKAGDELEIKTTLCDEIRDSHEAIVIDHVAKDEKYRDHHTPRIYGLRSYISFPIILKTGDFFGTLCAIGTEPAVLSDPKITGTFKLFADLLSFHLQSVDLVEKSFDVLQETKQKLSFTDNENRHYQYITEHNLQEQVRKINLFSDILLNNTDYSDIQKIQDSAKKINASGKELSSLIRHISTFSELSVSDEAFKPVDLNEVFGQVYQQLAKEKNSEKITFNNGLLPVVHALHGQMNTLFFQLLSYLVHVSCEKQPCIIKTYAKEASSHEVNASLPLDKTLNYCELYFECAEATIEEQHLLNMFDIIVHSDYPQGADRYEAGLAVCRKIAQNHKGYITADVPEGNGLIFKVVVPLASKQA
jgi:hypothetical protein